MSFDIHHNFRLISIHEQEKIRSYTRRFKPYSDFNFTSLLSWDTNETVEFALYKDCLIIKLPDYITQITNYSVLGGENASEVIDELFSLLEGSDAKFEFGFVPDSVIGYLDPARLTFSEDIDQNDYIYDTSEQALLEGRQFSWQRRRLSQFERALEGRDVEVRPLTNNELRQLFLDHWPAWQKASDRIPDSRYQFEKIAIRRYAHFHKDLKNQIVLGLFLDGKIEGVTMFEPSGPEDDYLTCHFMKVNYTYPGIFNRLFYTMAQYGYQFGYKYINFEQDLGIDGLRLYKNSLKPSDKLLKYRLRPKAQSDQLKP